MGIVYLIYFEKLAYVGSTVQTINARMRCHRNYYKGWQEGKHHYCSSFEIIQQEGYQVIIIEEVANETDDDLRWRERFWIDWYGKDNLVNKSRPIKTQKEEVEQHKKYYADNREEINRKEREYRAANRDELNRKRRERYAAEKQKAINEKN